MAEIILYITKSDAKTIVDWINSEDDIAWIVKDYQKGNLYRWKAIKQLSEIEPKEYCLWKISSGYLRIPSSDPNIKDSIVSDPFSGWEQTLDYDTAEVPWFGSAAPETFGFTFRENGQEFENSIGRSGFSWIGNYFSVIGTKAPDDCKKWWERLKRFIKKHATGIPWPEDDGKGRVGAYAFPGAYKLLSEGRPKDVNP